MIRSHPPRHAGCPRGTPLPFPVLTRDRYLRFTIYDLIFKRVIKYTEGSRGVTFAVRIIPRASSSDIVGEHDGALKIRVAAPPVEGAANRELIRFLAKSFKVTQNDVEIVSGAGAKTKIIRIRNMRPAEIDRLKFLK